MRNVEREDRKDHHFYNLKPIMLGIRMKSRSLRSFRQSFLIQVNSYSLTIHCIFGYGVINKGRDAAFKDLIFYRSQKTQPPPPQKKSPTKTHTN